jgi:GDP-4-dehydro-6-deoxy-D-mannose reductase
MKALITGITGFAGNYLADFLLTHGLELYGFSRNPEFQPFLPLDPRRVHYFCGDICDQTAVEAALREARPEFIFHLAGRTSPSRSLREPLETYGVNLQGALALLEATRLLKLRARLLIVSSSHVYGTRSAPTRVNEEAALAPETPYAASKSAAELAAHQYHHAYGIHVICVRAFNHTGPGQGPGFVCPDLARKILQIEAGERPPTLEVSNPDVWFDLSDVRDIVRGYCNALERGSPGKVYNLCSGKGITVGWVAETLAACSRIPIKIVPCASDASAGKWRGTVGDPTLADRELDWHTEVAIEDTLKDLLEYQREQVTGKRQ